MKGISFSALLLLAALVFTPGSAHAVLVDCRTIDTLDQLLPGNPGDIEGCIQQDKLFNDFSYSLGAGDAALVDTNFNLVFSGPEDIHSITFEREGGWQRDFTLGYTISVIAGPLWIARGDIQVNYPSQPGKTSTLTSTMTDSVPPGLTFVATAGTTDPPEQAFSGIVLSTDVLHSFDYTSATLSTLESSVTQSPIPEPGTYALIGSALLGLAALVRRRS